MCGRAMGKLHGGPASVGVPDAVRELARLRTAQARAPRNNLASYVMLFGADDGPRAALFDAELRFMIEMIEFDRIAMDHLLDAKVACPPPSPNMLDAVARLEPRAGLTPVRCFRLI